MPRDFSIPCTEADIEGFRAVFRSLPTYNAEEKFIYPIDVTAFSKGIGYFRTPEEYAVYEQYWAKNYNGVVPMEELMTILKDLADTCSFARAMAVAYDKDGNGFFSADEFEELIECCRVHNSKVEKIGFEEFVNVADTDKDGKVSIEECVKWIEGRLKM